MDVVKETDKLYPKRNQAISVGEYIAIAAINSAIQPNSKRSMRNWFSKTVLVRKFSSTTQTTLTSQRFSDHMDKIKRDSALSIWKNILMKVAKREAIDLSSVSYDGTNFSHFYRYT